MPQKSIPADIRAKAERLIRAGKLTLEAIGKECDLSKGTIWSIADGIGLSGTRQRKKVETRKKVHAEVKKGGTYREIARRTGLDESTIRGHATKPMPTEVTPAPPFPDAVKREWQPFAIDTPGHWLVISDIHIPCHDRTTIELAVGQAKRDGAVGVLLNGDVMDNHELSTHDKDPSLPRYIEEVRIAREFLTWLRNEFPAQRIVYKSGNHEARTQRYIAGRAPAIEALEGVSLSSILRFPDHGIEGVDDATVIRMGKLNVIHGHEYKGGGGVNPARWLYLKARSVAMTSHFHRTSEHHAKDIAGKHEAAWSIGCACDLHPRYAILNEWNNGFAMVHVDRDGSFGVRNMRVFNGKAV